MFSLNSSQPWLFSRRVDFLSFMLLPFLAVLIFSLIGFAWSFKSVLLIVGIIGFLDFAHIYAQWYRIYTNPMEKDNIFKYIGFIVVTLFVFGFLLFYNYAQELSVFLIYLAIFHFIKQQYGIFRIYSRVDKVRSSCSEIVNKWFIYLSMFYPIIWWHGEKRFMTFSWRKYFLDLTSFSDILNPIFLTLFISFLAMYIHLEYQNTRQNKFLNIPKNLTVLVTLVGWLYGIVFQRYTDFLVVAIIFHHNVSYFLIIWFYAKRDLYLRREGAERYSPDIMLKGNLKSFGFFLVYFFGVSFVAVFILALSGWTVHGYVPSYLGVDNLIKFLPQFGEENSFWKCLVWSTFFTSQGTHYIIDAFLWKKEKDYLFYLKNHKNS